MKFKKRQLPMKNPVGEKPNVIKGAKRNEDRMRTSSFDKASELMNADPEKAISILREWMYQEKLGKNI